MDAVAEVKEKIDIADFIGKYVQLKRTGKNYKGLCPFHNEKTPSFIVSPDIQRYRCFGCAKSGDIFNFVMDYEGMEFGEALKFLADKAGVEVKEIKNPQYDKQKEINKKVLEINTLALKFYNYLLTKHKAGEFARNYLRERGITQKTIDTFYLGYAPNAWDELSKFLKKKKYTDVQLVMAGICKPRKTSSTTYDIFRNRITFPFIDHLGRPVGFSARALEKDQNPKYINSPETPVFKKEKFLFGLNLAKKYIKEDGQVIIVEGMMDMISLYQNGYQNVVASGGTALTPGQINLLKRYTDTILLIFDNDAAGQEAMLRGVHVVKDAALNIKIGVLPADIKDPDDLMKSDPEKFKQIKKDSLPIWDFYIKFALKKYNIDSTFERKNAYNFLISAFSQIPDNVTKSKYVKKLIDLFEMAEQQILKDLQNPELINPAMSQSQSNTSNPIKPEQTPFGSYKIRYPEAYFLSLLLQLDKTAMEVYFNEVPKDLFIDPIVLKIYEALKSEFHQKGFEIKTFYDKLISSYPETNSLFERIYLLDSADFSDNSLVLQKELASTLKRLKQEFYKRELKKLSLAIRKAEAASEQSEIEELLKKADQYRELLKQQDS